jgi:hypothetical protein
MADLRCGGPVSNTAIGGLGSAVSFPVGSGAKPLPQTLFTPYVSGRLSSAVRIARGLVLVFPSRLSPSSCRRVYIARIVKVNILEIDLACYQQRRNPRRGFTFICDGIINIVTSCSSIAAI